MWIGTEATAMRDIHFTEGLLPDRALFRVEGAEARHFLHNLLTADIESLAEGEARYAALLSPQGKILFDIFVLRDGEAFLLDCTRGQRDELVKRLGFYKLRAKVTIAALDQAVGVSPSPRGWRDPRAADMGWRFTADAGSLPESPDYRAAEVALGLAETLGSGDYFPHEANLDQLGAVSFAKGCYVGQEVVSRMEHRGTARNRILPLDLDGDAPPAGSEIRAGDKLIGSLISTEGRQALALVRLDRLAEATEPLLTENVRVHVLKPRWARYDVPGSEGIA